MSLIYANKVNKMYGSTAMQAARAPAKEMSGTGKIKLRHHAEERELGTRHDAEWNSLKWQHQGKINRSIASFATDKLSPEDENKRQDDIKKLRAKQERQTSDMKIRHRRELEHHLKTHGIEA